MKTNAGNRRRNHFIEKSFQTKFIMKFCLLVVAAGVLTIALLYTLGMRSTTVTIVNSRVVVQSTADYLLPILIQTVLIVVVVVGMATVVVTLYVSHKIAGPLYRLKKAMQEISDGNFDTAINLRKFDQLQDIAQAFNAMAKKLKERLQR
jgi:nitrate/nitrite-specific signal transduction histidine kinase